MDQIQITANYEPNDVTLVKIDELVLMKVMKHALASHEKFFLGCLHGYKNKEVIQITSCYPYLPDTYSEENISEYDKEMTKSLTEMNLENFKVGWYQISFKLDNFVSYETFENQLNSIMEIPFFIYLAYDLLEAESGNPAPFKAYQLNEDFVKMANKKIKVEDLKQYTSKYDKVFTQVPIEIMSNPMNQLFFETYRTEMKQKYTSSVKNVQTFDTTHLMEKNSYCLYDAIEDQLQITNQINEPFFNKKNFPGVDQYVESIDVIDNIQSLQRLNNFTERIKNHGKFIQDSSTLLKKIVD